MGEVITVSFAPKGALQIPRGSQILVVGPPGVVKTTLALRFLADRLKVNEPAVFATTLWSPDQVRKTISQFVGKKLASQLRVADGVSCVTARPSKELFAFQNLYDLNTISLVMIQAMADIKNGHLCIDNLTTLMTYSAPLSVIKFLQVLCARVKDRGLTGLYILENGVHSEEVVATLRFCVDGMIEIHDVEESDELIHKIRLVHLRGTQVDTRWLVYNQKNTLQRES